MNEANFGDWLENACVPCVLALERLVLQLRTHCCCENHLNLNLNSSASSTFDAGAATVEDADPEADSPAAAPPGCSECAFAAFADATLALLLAQLAQFAPDRLLCEMLAMHADAGADEATASRETQRQRTLLVQSLRGLSLGGGSLIPADPNPNPSDATADPKAQQQQQFDSKSLANYYGDAVPVCQQRFAELQRALADRCAAVLAAAPLSNSFRTRSSASSTRYSSDANSSDSLHSLLRLHHLVEPEFADYLRMFAKISESAVLERVLGAGTDRAPLVSGPSLAAAAAADEPNSVDEALELLSSWSCDVRSLRLARVSLPDLARTLAVVETLSEHLMERDAELEHASLARRLQPACACRNPLLKTRSLHADNHELHQQSQKDGAVSNGTRVERAQLLEDRFLERFTFGIKLEVDLRRALDAASGREATALLCAPLEAHTPPNDSLAASSGSTGSLASANARLTPLNVLVPASPSPRLLSPLESVRSREPASDGEERADESPPGDEESTLHP